MILNKISATNLKGRTFEFVLGKGTLIVGPNFSGKTAIVEAIRLALMGYIPEVGKLPKATWELASDREMEVAVEFDGGTKITRAFIDGKAGHTRTNAVPAMFLEAIAGLPLLHAEHYFSLTDSQRTDYVFDRIRLPEAYSIESIWADLKRISLGEKHTEAVELAQRAILDDLNKWFGPGAVVQDALGSALEELRDKFTYWNRRAKETQGAVATLTELKVREKNVQAAPANLDLRIGTAQKELERLNTEKGRVTAERDAAERNAGRRKQLQQLLDADRIDYPRMLEQKQEEKEKIEKELVPEPDTEEIEEARRTITGATKIIASAEADVIVADKSIGEINERLAEIAHLKACPYCKAKGTGWKKTLEGELNERKTNAEAVIKAASKRRDKANEELRDANETLETLVRAQESNHRLREQIRDIERSINSITTDQKAEAEKHERYEVELAELPKPSATNLTREIAVLEEDRVATATKLSELNGRQQAEARVQQDILRATEAAKEHTDAEAYKILLKAVADFLKDKREAIICEAFTKLLQVANMVVKSILKSPLVLHENTIGRFEGAKFVPHRVFSGTEKALAYIAIAVALSNDAPLKLVLLDEFGRLDADNQVHMINRLLHLTNEGVIDQFIVVSTEIPQQVTINEGSVVMRLIEVGK